MKCSIEPQRQWLNSKQYFILNVRLQMPKHLTINHFRSAVMMICVAYEYFEKKTGPSFLGILCV